MTVHIAYFVDGTQKEEDSAGDIAQVPHRYLTTEEIHLADSFKAKRRRQFLAGRALLRWLCMETYHCPATQVSITLPGDGAPRVTIENQAIAASISHSHAAVMVAVTSYPSTKPGILAVDIEKIQQRRYQPEIVAAYTKGAMADVNSVSSFFLRWTQIEAVAKATQQSLVSTLSRPFAAHLPYLNSKVCQSFQLSVYARTSDGIVETDVRWQEVANSVNNFTKVDLI